MGTASWAATCAAQPAVLRLSAPTAVRPMRNAPTDVRPAMHKAPTDVHAMHTVDAVAVEARIRIVVVVPIAAVPPTPATKMMPPSRPAVHLVGKVGVFDGVTQAVCATEGDRFSRIGERAEGHDRGGRHGECERLHGCPPDRTCRSPPSHVDCFSNKGFHNRSWLIHSSHVHIWLTASVVRCILVRAMIPIPKLAASRGTFVCELCKCSARRTQAAQNKTRAAVRPPAPTSAG